MASTEPIRDIMLEPDQLRETKADNKSSAATGLAHAPLETTRAVRPLRTASSRSRDVLRDANAIPSVRMCVIVTVDITLLNLCRGRFEYLTSRGFDITVVCAPTTNADRIRACGVRLVTFPLTRSITPWTDLRTIISLWRFLRRESFDLVEVSTPKASLVGAIAARAASVPCVVQMLRGLAYQPQHGPKHRILKWAHTIPCRLSHEVIAISESLKELAVQEHVCPQNKIRVLGHGSSNGIDLDRFRPCSREERDRMRRSMSIPAGAVVVGFVGRITFDKGIEELVRAFLKLGSKHPELHFLLVGACEDRDRPSEDVLELIKHHERVRHVGWTLDTAPYYAAMDLLVLPSHREGFGGVLLEAAASGLPTIATDIPGCRDAVVEGVTGLFAKRQDVESLVNAIEILISDPELRTRMGSAGRTDAERRFAQEKVWALQEEALRLMAALRAKSPERRAALSILESKSREIDSACLPVGATP